MSTIVWLCLALATVLCADQVSKVAVCRRVGRNRSVRVGGHARLHHVVNADGLLGVRSPTKGLVFLWGLVVLCGLVVVEPDGLIGGGAAAAGVGVAIGGATGNLLDRLVRGHVVDFIQIGFWPIFNLADVGIVGGIAVTVAALLV
jgi:signal peptidase II